MASFAPNHLSIVESEFCTAKLGLFPDISKCFSFFLHHHAIFLQKISSRATRIMSSLRLCRSFEHLSLHPHQKVKEKLANVQKRPYLCGVKKKINEQLTIDFRDENKTTKILTIKKYTTMYAIAFFTTVIVFSASLYVGYKIAESVSNRKSSTTDADNHIRPVETNTHIGLFRVSA